MPADLPAKMLRRIPEKFLSSKLDDELILIQGDSGAFFSLKDVGLEIWQIIERPSSLSEISRELIEDYDVTQQECEAAVREFADDLVAAGLAEFV